MSCRSCESDNQQLFTGELTVAFPGLQRVKFAPVYICEKTLVYLDCGFTELIVPLPQLEQINKGMRGLHLTGESSL
jgi:hypothetical protein